MVIPYRGREQWRAYLDALEAADEEGGTLSPGGAAMMLGVDRARIYQLVDHYQDIRAWAYFDVWGKQAAVYEVSVPDLLRWSIRSGRFRSVEDLPLPWEPVVKAFERELRAYQERQDEKSAPKEENKRRVSHRV